MIILKQTTFEASRWKDLNSVKEWAAKNGYKYSMEGGKLTVYDVKSPEYLKTYNIEYMEVDWEKYFDS